MTNIFPGEHGSRNVRSGIEAVITGQTQNLLTVWLHGIGKPLTPPHSANPHMAPGPFHMLGMKHPKVLRYRVRNVASATLVLDYASIVGIDACGRIELLCPSHL